ncbi:MAG: bifunctional DNA-formamidopyrimidine glycosylase/DNA-(apurinic or apyrimidinic site) lyase [Akkermansiaceae bacterium]|nr:bifunctional DNA-formamidopyrimidine glycosylase/DNA-(apurinic or apyrimidinic site) lyase [Akkermansiaceae bacterium]MDP4646021.1 bifunctional DNA-formamidopyrimidine glycosylase/DNA-(apurinic or apyrimidinic site) lyase [Akkermansiaceae bacterium]MDP4722000.1 bifunctional DNA-formamidopyrimidine glycosylase/DNA-(apurinic or apyrimidinic site) lyase [Akkermansiaceae bacterium]MDP4780821.1 bifunctional DNA-formamidopyrimidine glycosylase/DNA-(apurinic or apyrimidinic site) lyase [Akkermansiac
MPELPEVETTKLGISPHVVGGKICEVIVQRSDLRWPVSPELGEMAGVVFVSVKRRSKYLLLETDSGQVVLVHLGMSGSLRLVPPAEEWRKHDHIGITLSGGLQLRYHDPRRFGLVLVVPLSEIQTHPLLKNLGPEPLEEGFTGAHLHAALRGKTIALKVAIMDAKVVVGVGNIYASESLFRAGIHPRLPAEKLSKPKAERLVAAIKEVLTESITQGGTTLRDFLNSDGQPGYFKQRLFVYGRKGEPCRVCETPISHAVLGQRATFWCAVCQRR